MKKILIFVLSIMLLATILIGCDKKAVTVANDANESANEEVAETKDDKEAENEETDNEQNNEKETLEIWAFFEGFPKDAADYYSELCGVEVNYIVTAWSDYQVKLSSSVGTDEMPDILQLPVHFFGRYAKTGQFTNLDDAFGGRPLYESYKAVTATATLEGGYFEGVPIGIGWEANVGGYYYREDLAREGFGINSVEEMEAIISNWDGFYTLNEMKKPGYEDVAVMGSFGMIKDALLALTPQFVVDGKFEFTPELEYCFTESKKLVDAGMVYLDGLDATAIINAAQDDAFLGSLSESWWVQTVKTFEQEGLWRVAEAPIYFSSGGTWWAIPLNADKEKAWGFLSETFLNEEWLYVNLPVLGNFIANGNVMDRAIQESILADEYFGDQIIGQKFIDIEKKTTDIKQKSEYFMSIQSILGAKIKEYAWDGVYNNLEEVYVAIEDEINSVFPDIEVIR